MSKALKIKRLIYIILMALFLICGFLPLIKDTRSDVTVYYSCYEEIRDVSALYIYGNIFLAIPFVSAAFVIVLNLIEIIAAKAFDFIKYSSIGFVLLQFIFGVMFAAIANQMFPFGCVVLVLDLLVLINAIVFNYGIKGQVV